MAAAPLAEDIRRFIVTSIASVPHLEALLLLRAEPGTLWDATGVASRLYIPEKIAAQALRELADAGFVQAHGASGYRYQPLSPGQDEMVKRVADAYAHHLIEVTNLIHERPRARVQEFAEAFKFRKE